METGCCPDPIRIGTMSVRSAACTASESSGRKYQDPIRRLAVCIHMQSATDSSECARRVSAAMMVLPWGIRLLARPTPQGIELTLTLFDESGPRDIKEQEIFGLESAASEAGSEHFAAFLEATARWLGAVPVDKRADLYPRDVFVIPVALDARLRSIDDYCAVLADPLRREAYVAYGELREFLESNALAAPNDDALRALYAMTAEGRASKGVPEAVRGVRWLASSDWGRGALVAMMREWADEPWDAGDVAWRGGPGVTALLLSGAWRILDPVLPDGELRRRAIASVDRIANRPTSSELALAGFE